ncbi:MAG: flagellar export protein FliJ [Bdellovibrionia bacterium]
MKFKFRLEKVMNHKKVERDLAFRDFADARKTYEEGKERLKNLYQEIADARNFEAATVKEGGKGSESLKWSAFFIDGQNIKIELQKKLNRQLIQVMEQKQEVLIERARELKTFETLKEKMKERFKKEERKRDIKSIDEIVVMSAAARRDGTGSR